MASDHDMALKIAEMNRPYNGRGGSLIPNVAMAVAAGIALGRKLEREARTGDELDKRPRADGQMETNGSTGTGTHAKQSRKI